MLCYRYRFALEEKQVAEKSKTENRYKRKAELEETLKQLEKRMCVRDKAASDLSNLSEEIAKIKKHL